MTPIINCVGGERGIRPSDFSAEKSSGPAFASVEAKASNPLLQTKRCPSMFILFRY